jgi:hypothetical protein
MLPPSMAVEAGPAGEADGAADAAAALGAAALGAAALGAAGVGVAEPLQAATTIAATAINDPIRVRIMNRLLLYRRASRHPPASVGRVSTFA